MRSILNIFLIERNSLSFLVVPHNIFSSTIVPGSEYYYVMIARENYVFLVIAHSDYSILVIVHGKHDLLVISWCTKKDNKTSHSDTSTSYILTYYWYRWQLFISPLETIWLRCWLDSPTKHKIIYSSQNNISINFFHKITAISSFFYIKIPSHCERRINSRLH
jgi:hypothetical protein